MPPQEVDLGINTQPILWQARSSRVTIFIQCIICSGCVCCALLYLRFLINPTTCLCNRVSNVVARSYSGVTALTSSFSGGSDNLHKENHLRFFSKDLLTFATEVCYSCTWHILLGNFYSFRTVRTCSEPRSVA